ncbi:MAG: hypothetical protein R3310_04525 [Candidatus Competibacteraceae bacterium]|nr:hypothetical protein [Candidatus Competibacteraceae bacterium]
MQHIAPRQIARLALLGLGLGVLGGAGADSGDGATKGNSLLAQVQEHGLRQAWQSLSPTPAPRARGPVEPRLAKLLIRHRHMAGTVLLGDLPAGGHGHTIDHQLRLVHNLPEPARER